MRYSSESSRHANQAGFTLIELAVIAPIIMLILGGLIFAVVTLTGGALAERGQAKALNDASSALAMIENDIKSSTAFVATSGAVQPPQGYDNNDAAFHNASLEQGNALILAVPLTTTNPILPARELVHTANAPHACEDPLSGQNILAVSAVVYFIKDDSLWRRVVMPPGYDTPGLYCKEPWQQPTCHPEVTRGTYCQADDTLVASGVNVDNFNVEYFTSPTAETPASTASDPNASIVDRQAYLDTSDTVKVELTIERMAGGQDISHTRSTKVSRFN